MTRETWAGAMVAAAIDMVRLLPAVARQLLKQGKVPQSNDFDPYRAVVAAEAVRLPEVAQ